MAGYHGLSPFRAKNSQRLYYNYRIRTGGKLIANYGPHTSQERGVANSSSSPSEVVVQQDSLDQVLDLPSHTAEERRTCATEILNIFTDRITDIRNWLATMRTLLDDKKARLTTEQA